ncbi:hypothetical protein B9Z19DRAFT_1192004 [Tuber borchii]|uniref:Uncharacterized protein n=1 Tax=Tuber borchii TaxID=42251 RepID=A0A2T6ZXS5_TUBBO|nr:hypothetical protein B9Z19DRAFT_1192004 [Tuber borchii]
MSFYTIPSIHHQKDVPIREFSRWLQRNIKGWSLCRVFLDVWKALTLKPDSGSVRHVIMEPFYDVLLHHPIYPPPKGRPNMNVWKALTLRPDSGSVRHVIMEPLYNVVLHHPIRPSPKGRPHTSILHGATESSEGGRAQTLKPDIGSVRPVITEPLNNSVLRDPIYPPPNGRHYTSIFHGATESSERGVLMPGIFRCLKSADFNPDSGSVRHVITDLFYNVILRHPICPPPKGRLHTSILHGATEFSEEGVIMLRFFSPGWLESAHFKDSSYVNN